MAFNASRNPQIQKDNMNVLVPQGSSPQGADQEQPQQGSSTSPTQAQTQQSSSAPPSSGSYSNLKKYISANQGGGSSQKLAGAIQKNQDQGLAQVNQAVKEQQNLVNTSLQKNQNMYDTTKSQGEALINQALSSGKLSDEDKGSFFDITGGRTQFGELNEGNFTQAEQQAQQFAQQAQKGSREEGLRDMLATSIGNNPNREYSSGQKGLDFGILGKDRDVRSNLVTDLRDKSNQAATDTKSAMYQSLQNVSNMRDLQSKLGGDILNLGKDKESAFNQGLLDQGKIALTESQKRIKEAQDYANNVKFGLSSKDIVDNLGKQYGIDKILSNKDLWDSMSNAFARSDADGSNYSANYVAGSLKTPLTKDIQEAARWASSVLAVDPKNKQAIDVLDKLRLTDSLTGDKSAGVYGKFVDDMLKNTSVYKNRENLSEYDKRALDKVMKNYQDSLGGVRTGLDNIFSDTNTISQSNFNSLMKQIQDLDKNLNRDYLTDSQLRNITGNKNITAKGLSGASEYDFVSKADTARLNSLRDLLEMQGVSNKGYKGLFNPKRTV